MFDSGSQLEQSHTQCNNEQTNGRANIKESLGIRWPGECADVKHNQQQSEQASRNAPSKAEVIMVGDGKAQKDQGTVITTFPRACPSPRYRRASAVSRNG
jgi:hypothetical protein